MWTVAPADVQNPLAPPRADDRRDHGEETESQRRLRLAALRPRDAHRLPELQSCCFASLQSCFYPFCHVSGFGSFQVRSRTLRWRCSECGAKGNSFFSSLVAVTESLKMKIRCRSWLTNVSVKMWQKKQHKSLSNLVSWGLKWSCLKYTDLESFNPSNSFSLF